MKKEDKKKNKKAKKRDQTLNRLVQEQQSGLLRRKNIWRQNPNGKRTKETPNLLFTKMAPYRRSTDKFDEQSALLDYLKDRPRPLSRNVRELRRVIITTSRQLDSLERALGRAKDDVMKKRIQADFVRAREINYAAIDEMAIILFGDCGAGGEFHEYVKQNIILQLLTGRLRPMPASFTVGN